MVLTGCALVPHGTMMLDLDVEGLPQGVPELYERTMAMMTEINSLDIDLLVLVTPHGLCLERDIGIYTNKYAAGNAEWNGMWGHVKADIKLSRKCSRELLDAWRADGVGVQGVNALTSCPTVLSWAEVIPIWMLKKLGYAGKIIIVSMPHSQISNGMATDPAHVDNIHRAGERLAEYCDTGMWSDDRVFVAVSGDLAHAHPTLCTNPTFLPHPTWSLPKSPAEAVEFDRKFEEWVVDTRRGKTLAGRCLELEVRALSCALAGCLLLEGAMFSQHLRDSAFDGKVFVNKTPTYFTMMAALFTPCG
ncbi:uncharacterized protein LOC135824478 [Sycon ciliatum]|uniref:uncharacterized protein LOC135824478 n=1 Tax=Sycon ciliatum TaxID=27933 RepID=UPI0031F6FE1A